MVVLLTIRHLQEENISEYNDSFPPSHHNQKQTPNGRQGNISHIVSRIWIRVKNTLRSPTKGVRGCKEKPDAANLLNSYNNAQTRIIPCLARPPTATFIIWTFSIDADHNIPLDPTAVQGVLYDHYRYRLYICCKLFWYILAPLQKLTTSRLKASEGRGKVKEARSWDASAEGLYM